MRTLIILVVIAIAVIAYQQLVDPSLFGLIEQSPAERVDQAVDEMGDAAGEAADAAGDVVEDAADNAGDDTTQ